MLKPPTSRMAVLLLAVFLAVSSGSSAEEAAFVGMQIQGLSPAVGQALGLAQPKGVLVRDVALGGPAAAAGFQRGDLIVRYGGKEVGTFESLVALVRETKAGAKVPVEVVRAGRRISLDLGTTGWPAAWAVTQNAFATLPYLGVTLASLTPKTREALELPWGTTGVVVSLLDPDKEGAKALRRGDLIVQVNQQDVWMPDQVMDQIEKAKAAGRPNVLILVEGRDGYRFTLLPVR
jgi:serine protease Do